MRQSERNPSLTWAIVIAWLTFIITLWLYLQPEVWTEWGR